MEQLCGQPHNCSIAIHTTKAVGRLATRSIGEAALESTSREAG